ncbi:hypothetical protein L208DRAFT_1506867 [Tricholoma matsutake]|nr:hypothetical protein L208DRAFT_1506867 [Tricholoma matsutake 945]
MDNAGNNDALARYLPTLIPSFQAMAACGCCFPHIINLLAKIFISFFFWQPKKKVKNSEAANGMLKSDDFFKSHTVAAIADDDDSDDELAVHGEGIENDSAAVLDDGRDIHDTAIVKTTCGQAIEMMRKKGISIDPVEEKMALQLFPHKFDILVTNDKDLSGNKDTLDRQVPTQWNSDLTCLDAHLYFRSPVEQLTGAAINKLQAYRLSEDQWDLAETLSL